MKRKLSIGLAVLAWVEPIPKLDPLTASLAARPSFVSTKPYV
ncbi:MAG: hypothetical protein QM651_06265 [Rhodoblastus sp.]